MTHEFFLLDIKIINVQFENSCLHAHGEIEQRPFPQKEAGFKVGLFSKKNNFPNKINLFLL